MGYDFGGLGAGDSVFLGFPEMESQGGIGNPLRDQGGDGYKTAVAQRKQIVAAPYFAEKDVVVEVGELGGEVAEGVAPGGLNYLLLCHNGCR